MGSFPSEFMTILRNARTIAVVGLSDDSRRTSYQIARYMRDQGYRIIPVNPQVSSVFGIRAYPSLSDVPKDVSIDIVNIFRKSESVPEVVDQAVERGVGCLWMQLGVIHEEAAKKAREAGIPTIMDSCIAVARQTLQNSPPPSSPAS